LIPRRFFCYIRKVLVGPGTPYLGPDSNKRRENNMCRFADALKATVPGRSIIHL